MNGVVRPEVAETVLTIGLAALAASLALWAWIIRRAVRRQPIAPYQPRKPVPWLAIDLLLVFVFQILFAGMAVELDRRLFPEVAAPPAKAAAEAKPSTEHDLLLVLREERNLGTLLLCLAAAVIVAPIAEEVFFRLLLQGWLEKLERQGRRAARLPRGVFRGALPVLGSSVAFALLHFRAAESPPSAHAIFHRLACIMLAEFTTIAFALAWVRVRAGATAVDLGFRRGKLPGDIGLGLLAGVAVVPWLYILQFSLAYVLPKSISPDPFTLFPFAIMLGLLYYRTHRIVPSIVLHAVLNTVSLALAWYILV